MLCFAALTVIAACGGDEDGRAPEAARQPLAPLPAVGPEDWNVVLITLDTVRADSIGVYGQIRDVTPNIDRMAWEGIMFDAAVSSSPSTLPSHASIFTGKHPFAHGTRSNLGYELSPEQETLAECLAAGGRRTGAEIAAVAMGAETRIAQGFEGVRDPRSTGVSLKSVRRARDASVEQFPIRVAADIARRGRDFIRANRGRAFFLWLHFFDAHEPHRPPEPFASKFRDDSYLAEVANQDAAVGSILAMINELGLRNRTLVVLTADHGEEKHSYFVYDSTMRVPLIFWGPDSLPRGKRIGSVVRTIDLTPTILDLLRQPPIHSAQGVSLHPLINGERQDLALTGYGESLQLQEVFGLIPLRFIREGNWKYIHKVNPEIYDLASDPFEQENLAGREPERVAKMRARLHDLVSESDEPSDSSIAVDDATRANLAALGYAASGSTPVIADEIESLQLVGDDATTKIAAVRRLAEGQGLLQTREFGDAHVIFNELLEDDPDSSYLLGMSGLALLRDSRPSEAIAVLDRAVALDPDNRILLRQLVIALERSNRTDEATKHIKALLELAPCSDVRVKLYLYAYQQKNHDEMFRVMAEGAERCPDSASDQFNFAWVLATVPVDDLRDGQRAVEIAERAVSLLETSPEAAQLDTLAAAHAEAGDFNQATRFAREALARLEADRAPESAIAMFRAHWTEIEAGRAIRDHRCGPRSAAIEQPRRSGPTTSLCRDRSASRTPTTSQGGVSSRSSCGSSLESWGMTDLQHLAPKLAIEAVARIRPRVGRSWSVDSVTAPSHSMAGYSIVASCRPHISNSVFVDLAPQGEFFPRQANRAANLPGPKTMCSGKWRARPTGEGTGQPPHPELSIRGSYRTSIDHPFGQSVASGTDVR